MERFYDVLNEIDYYEVCKSRRSSLLFIDEEESKQSPAPTSAPTNFFLQQLQTQRAHLETSRSDKHESWLDRQPFLKIEYRPRKTNELGLQEESGLVMNSCLRQSPINRKRSSLGFNLHKSPK